MRETTDARRSDFIAAISVGEASDHFFPGMPKREKAAAEQNSQGRCGHEPDREKVEEKADRKVRCCGPAARRRERCGMRRVKRKPMVPVLGERPRYPGQPIGVAGRIERSGRARRYHLLRQLIK